MRIYRAPLSRIALYISEGVQAGEGKRRERGKKHRGYMLSNGPSIGSQSESEGLAKLLCACAHIYAMVCLFHSSSRRHRPSFRRRQDAIGSSHLRECHTDAYRARAKRNLMIPLGGVTTKGRLVLAMLALTTSHAHCFLVQAWKEEPWGGTRSLDCAATTTLVLSTRMPFSGGFSRDLGR